MGFLDRLFGKKRAERDAADAQAVSRGQAQADRATQRHQQREQPSTLDVPPCPHTTLVPRWDSVADMGKEDKVTSYTCEGCAQSFTGAEGRALRQTEAERVQRELATPDET